MTHPTVAILHLARPGGLGGLGRVRGLHAIFAAAGATVIEVKLLREHRAGIGDLSPAPFRELARSAVVPESLSWSTAGVLRRLREIEPDVVLCETARAYHPALLDGPWHVVIDFVDRLSVSYRDRSGIVTNAGRRALFRALGHAAARFESRAAAGRPSLVAAGWADAHALGAGWLPTVIDLPAHAPDPDADGARRCDLVFFGNLAYPPIAEAVDRLATLWPVMRWRDGRELRLLLAGAHASAAQRSLATRLGWEVQPDFADLSMVLGSARLALVPLRHASGLQTKVIEAAAYGVPQVLDPVAAAGLDPKFPIVVAADDGELVRQAHALLADDERRRELGRAARRHISESYTPQAWVGWAHGLFEFAKP